MTTMDFTVGVSRINPDPTKCIMLVTQASVVSAGKGSYDIEVNGDIHVKVKNVTGLEGSNIKFHLNDIAWSFVQSNPIVIAQATGVEGCTPPTGPAFPPGIGFAGGSTPGARDVTINLPKAPMNSPGEYHYWLQVMKVGQPGTAKWVHPKIRNDTISSFAPRNPFFHYFVEHPLIGLVAIVAALLAAVAIGFYAGRKR